MPSQRETQTENLNVISQEPLTPPAGLKAELPLGGDAARHVAAARRAIQAIIDRQDPRLLVVVGPCSIHDPEAALDYARRLQVLQAEVSDSLLLVMRAYFEKPRTTTGWKGLINDPELDDSFRIEQGLRTARELLLELAQMGLPLATEALDPITPQYLHDLIAWSAIGARTTESQTHREMASGLSSPVGFKNGTDGGLDVALNALQSVAHPHRFLGINQTGEVSIIETRGNRYAHVVLRGGSKGPNYSREHVASCAKALQERGLPPNIMVDCSHANSSKDHDRQPIVLRDVAEQILHGDTSIIGVMLESHINAGNQKLGADPSQLAYGTSITDACIDWDTTATVLRQLAETLGDALAQRSPRMADIA